jgi:hypothetical protein
MWPAGDEGKCTWPPDLPREETVASFRLLFGRFGYLLSEDAELEIGFEKIALFVDSEGNPLHACDTP